MRSTDPAAPTLALVAAVALQEVLAAAAPERAFRIKWPNDILAHVPAQENGDWAKLAGILLEREGDAVVLGFGVNLAHHPDNVGRSVTSLAALAGMAFDPAAFADMLAEAFQRWLARWRGEGLSPIRARWLERAHPSGTALSAETPDGRIDGLFDGLTEEGALRLRLADGSARVIHAGDVFLI